MDVEEAASSLTKLRPELGPTGEDKTLKPDVVEIVREIAAHGAFDSKKQFTEFASKVKRRHSNFVKNSELRRVYTLLLERGQIEPHSQIEFFLRTKVGKSASGILSITVFTSPYPEYIDPATGKLTKQKFSCQWNCYYCPNHPDHPRSYLPDEPGCLRAERLNFIAADQLTERVETLRRIGHPIDKLEVLVLGGTWESYPETYRESFIRDLFYSANTFFSEDPRRAPMSLEEEQRENEDTRVKIIGLTIETRPDTVTPQSIRELRRIGCTRLQLGIQHVDDEILDKINRKHTADDARRALKLLKDNCYKVDIHIMPDLPGASPDIDRAMFDQLLGVRRHTTVAERFTKYELVATQTPRGPCDPWRA